MGERYWLTCAVVVSGARDLVTGSVLGVGDGALGLTPAPPPPPLPDTA